MYLKLSGTLQQMIAMSKVLLNYRQDLNIFILHVAYEIHTRGYIYCSVFAQLFVNTVP